MYDKVYFLQVVRTAGKAALKAKATLQGKVEGEVAEAIETYARINAEIKALEDRQDDAKRVILEAHKSAAKLATAAGFKSSFSDASERASFDSKAFGEAHPQLLAQFQKVTKVSASCRVTAPKAKKG